MAFSHVMIFCRAVVAEMADYVQMPTADEAKKIAHTLGSEVGISTGVWSHLSTIDLSTSHLYCHF